MQYDTKRATLSGVVGGLRVTGGDNPRLNFQLEQTLPGKNNEPRTEYERIVIWADQIEVWRPHLQNGMRIRIDDARPTVRTGDDGAFISYTIDRQTQISVLLGGEVRSMPGPDYTEPPQPTSRPAAARPAVARPATGPARPAARPAAETSTMDHPAAAPAAPAAPGATPPTPRPAGPPRLPAARPPVPIRSTPTVEAAPTPAPAASESEAPNAAAVIERLRRARNDKKTAVAGAAGTPDY